MIVFLCLYNGSKPQETRQIICLLFCHANNSWSFPQKRKTQRHKKKKKLQIHAYFINHATIVKHHIQTSTRFIKNIFHFDTFQGDEKACFPCSKQFTRGPWNKKYLFLEKMPKNQIEKYAIYLYCFYKVHSLKNSENYQSIQSIK